MGNFVRENIVTRESTNLYVVTTNTTIREAEFWEELDPEKKKCSDFIWKDVVGYHKTAYSVDHIYNCSKAGLNF